MNSSCKLILLIFITLFLKDLKVSGQCCSAGNPVGGDGSNANLKSKQLQIFTSFRRSYSRDYFHENNKENNQYINKSYYNFSNLSVSYGLTKRITIHTELGYFYKKLQEVNLPGGTESIASSGLGDLALSLRYSLLKGSFADYKQLVLSAGTRLPIGAFEESSNGITIPISLQPSSGAFKINTSLFFSHKRNDNLLGWNAYSFLEWSDQIEKGFLVYNYGNYFMIQGSVIYSKSAKFVALLGAKFEYRANDYRENQIKIQSTGSKVVYIKPQLHYRMHNNFHLSTSLELPIYKYVNGSQLTNLYAFQVGIRRIINL